MSRLFKFSTPLIIAQRNVGKCKFDWYGEGIQYPGFKYYPRDPENFKDPPYAPSKLFRVERIKPIKGTAQWERKQLEEFKLDGKNNSYVIVKNIPENNQRLWKVKHLVKITPITFPDGFPKESDVTYLKENGELRIIQKIHSLEEKMQLTDKFQSNVRKLDGDTLRRHSRLKWLQGWD